MNLKKRLSLSLGALAIAFGLHTPAAAQYDVFLWENFDSGTLPSNFRFGHDADKTNVRPFAYNSPGAPPAMRAGVAFSECGTAGLLLEPRREKNTVSVSAPITLDRSRLGTKGRALFQADFYLPAEGQQIPTFSLLAMAPQKPGATTPNFSLYRFGVLRDGKRIFFSFANGTPAPVLFYNSPISDFKIQRPGWARFQIIFEGQDRILCSINGQPTKFPEIRERTLNNLSAGVMVAVDERARKLIPCFMDNLSIQWTPDAAPLPESPWRSRKLNAVTDPLFAGGGNLYWYPESKQAWEKSNEQKKPLLAFFYVPNNEPTRYLDRITPNTDEARELLNRFVLLKLDANQLAGGTAARRFKITRTPTLIVMEGGQETRRLAIIPNRTQWTDVEQFLVGKSGDAGVISATEPVPDPAG